MQILILKPWMINNKNQKGFTLTEMLVVIALIALITGLFFSRGSTYFRLSIDTAARKFAPVVKETYNQTMLTGRIHRIAYDLKENTYWVEVGSKNFLLETAESKEKNKSIFSKDDESQNSSFTLEKSITSRKRSLPGGVEFSEIFNEQDSEPIKEGITYTHFFPHGITEQTIIHLSDTGNNKKTIAITPIIGNTIVENNHLTRGEIYGD